MQASYKIKRETCADVVVVGGGTAGVFAAIAAARAGAKTILIEKNSILGGTITVANVNFPGLFFAWGRQIINGPCWESIERTIALGGAKMPKITFKPEKHWYEQIRLNRFVYTTVLFQMCEEAGVEVVCSAMVSDVMERDNGIDLLITEKSGLLLITTQIAIDATGDANLCQIAGYSVVKSETQQPATLQTHLSGYDMDAVSVDEIKERLPAAGLPEYVRASDLLAYLRDQRIDVHIPCVDADTSQGKTALGKRALLLVMQIYQFLRSIKGLSHIEIDFMAEEVGVRETNRIVGEHMITAEEYIHGMLYPDSVCYAFYPIDLHVMHGIEKVYHQENVVSKVPYSALIPRGARRILCAGRCISSDTYANSAIRVEATCMATGQAAGCAAAVAALQNVWVNEVEYANICRMLEKIHAIVPHS
ncbi:MAG: FAD-dependent oxidoreductase [Clostridia bacterium]|nr:FAD-dependent oxidoreductase [Clostridia bacterium]